MFSAVALLLDTNVLCHVMTTYRVKRKMEKEDMVIKDSFLVQYIG